MSTQPEMIAQAQTVMAGLQILLEYGERAGMPTDLLSPLRAVADTLDRATPPWEPEPGPSSEIPWSQVACGDKVLAPNGTWYPVDAISRTGRTIKALLVYGDKLLPTVRDAGDMVKVERGDTGRAMDLFAAGGINLETIKSGAGQ